MVINILECFVFISSFIALFLTCEADLDYRKIPRVKRVINGKPVLVLNSEYRSVQFFVLIQQGHSGQVKCGGSLLTSTIMQTACHCVAIFLSPKDGYLEAQLENVWEDFIRLYPGAVPLKTVQGVTPKKYIKHPNCRQGESRRIYYDYGLIILSKSMRGIKDRFAPVYTISALADLFVLTQAKDSVCLIVGYGRFRLLKNQYPDSAEPNELLHGWIRVTNYLDCYESSYLEEPGLGDNQWIYKEDATWICTRTFSNHDQQESNGDSGSPIVCSNQYVGLVSAIDYFLNESLIYKYLFATAMSTAFTIFENSAEYRAAFIQVLREFDYTAIVNKHSDLFNYKPTVPRIHQYGTIARNNKDHLFPNSVLTLTFAVFSFLSYSYTRAN